MAGRDDGGSGCDVVLLGQRGHCQGVRTVSGAGQAVSGLRGK